MSIATHDGERAAGIDTRAFVGRGVELAELLRGLDDARAGRGRLYLLSGEPGIGKTRLCDEVSSAAQALGMPVFWGRAWESGGAPAYWLWIDALGALCEAADAAQLADIAGGDAALLVELLPALRTRLPEAGAASVVSSAEEARFRLFRAAAGWLRRAAGSRGMLLVLDDLHAADESSIALLCFLARELRSMRVLVLATFRDVEARLSSEIGEALGRLTREGTSLSLSRLGPTEGAELLRVRAGGRNAALHESIYKRTQGNPLFLEEMARLLTRDDAPELLDDALPAGVRDVIRQRLSRVSADTRAVLELAAVSGDESEPSLIAQAGELSPRAVSAAVAEAERAGVVVSRQGRVRFSHALVREVLHRDLSAEPRAALHLQLAAAKEQRAAAAPSPPYAELANHLFEAGDAQLERAVGFALGGAEQAAALFAFEEAIVLLERALRRVEAQPQAVVLRAQVLIALGSARIRRGAGVRGQQECLQAAALVRTLAGSADPALRARHAELLASAALAYGREITAALVNPVLVELLSEALAALPPGDSPLRVELTARLAAAMQPHVDMLYPIALAQEAIAAARRLGEPRTLLSAIATGMAAMMDVSDPGERLPLNREAEQLATRFADRERLLRTQCRIVFDHLELGELATAAECLATAERSARQAGAQRYLWRIPLFHSMFALTYGRFAEAEERLEQARALGEQADDPQLPRCYVLHREGMLRIWERHADMLAYDPEARVAQGALYAGPQWQNAASALTYSRVEDLEGTARYLARLPQDEWPLVQNPPAFMHLGEPLAMCGRLDQVRSVYEQLLPASHRCISWGWTKFVWDGPATRCLALLAARLELWPQAEQHFERALAQVEQLGALPYLARTRYELARTLHSRARAQDRDRVLRLLDETRQGAQALGMSGLIALAERVEAAVGGAARSPSTRPPSAAASAAPAALVAPAVSFEPEGEYWSVSYAGSVSRLRDSLGLQYLAKLFAEPGRDIHVLELSAAVSGTPSDAPPVTDTGDAGELLDETARLRYRARLEQLRDELEDAESRAAADRAERAREEMELLAAELSRAVGVGGRSRRAGQAAERARSAVQRRIRNAVERARDASPALADYLESTVRTGTYCVYRPELHRPK